MNSSFLLSCLIGLTLTLTACSEPTSPMETNDQHPEQPTEKIIKTDAEWKALLTPTQYRILRKAGTEAPNGATYKAFNAQKSGVYYCAGCQAELFSSKEKFHSGCGWPSFYDPSQAKNVKEKKDISAGMERTEIVCSVCDGHLGHLFHGEGFGTPTDKRYCINGAALLYVPKELPETKEQSAPREEE